MKLDYYCFSEYLDKWLHPSESEENVQFTIHNGCLVCLVWDKYDIVEEIRTFIPLEEKEFFEQLVS